jgi:hypothetical protein
MWMVNPDVGRRVHLENVLTFPPQRASGQKQTDQQQQQGSFVLVVQNSLGDHMPGDLLSPAVSHRIWQTMVTFAG